MELIRVTLMNALVLQKLNQDHKNIAKVLYCLKAEIRGYVDSESESHIDQIMNILDYISTVPERWHHPLEDLVFNKLLEKNPPYPEQIKAVLHEHEDLERLTQELRNSFEFISTDIKVSASALYRTATIYLSRQMLHLDAEETVIFPLANEYLDDDDWDSIDQLASEQLEPQGGTEQLEYEKLLESIFNYQSSQ